LENTDYIHFLITRFNLKSTWSEDKNGIETNTEAWLENRYHLYQKYCFSSVKNQKTKNFTWLVYFDSDTPNKYKEINNSMKSNFSNFVPVYKSSYNEFLDDIGKDLKEYINERRKIPTHVITTRLDNDDALHRDSVDAIQSCFNNQHLGIIDIIKGYGYRISNRKILTKRNYKLNPFISLVEELGDALEIKTVYNRPHTEWTDVNYTPYTKKRLWMQIIHEKNIVNKLWGEPILNVEEKDAFPFVTDLNIKSILNVLKYRLKMYLKPSKLMW